VAQGVSAAWVSGETPVSLRRSFLEKLRKSELSLIVNCVVFTEGFDEPSLGTILVARPTKKGQKSPVIDLSQNNLPLLVNLENLSSSVKELDLFGLDAFAWYKGGASHYVQVNDAFSLSYDII
jgi:hypothetical protein